MLIILGVIMVGIGSFLLNKQGTLKDDNGKIQLSPALFLLGGGWLLSVLPAFMQHLWVLFCIIAGVGGYLYWQRSKGSKTKEKE